MNRREVTILAFKVLAAYVVLGSVGSIESLISNWYLFQPEQRVQMISVHLLPAGIAIGIGVLVWISSEALASRVFPESSSQTASLATHRPAKETLEIAFAVIGLWLVVHSFPALINWVALYVFSLRGEPSVMGGRVPLPLEQKDQLFDIRAKASIVTHLVKLIIGVVLLLGTRTSVDFLKRVKNAFLFTSVETGEEDATKSETQSDLEKA